MAVPLVGPNRNEDDTRYHRLGKFGPTRAISASREKNGKACRAQGFAMALTQQWPRRSAHGLCSIAHTVALPVPHPKDRTI